jgi:hypothetical protein
VESVIPEGVRGLFWDTDPLGLELPKHADYVLERLTTRGGLGRDVLGTPHLLARGARVFSPP